MHLNKLTLVKVSNLPKQVRRPMTFRPPMADTSINLDVLPESLHEDNIMDVSLGMDASTLPLAIGNVCESVNLPCGDWSDERFMFKAELDITASNIFSNAIMTATIYGFTDTANVLSGMIDPFMQFHVNRVRISRGVELKDGYRSIFVEDKIIARGNFEVDREMDMLIRPSDVLCHTAMLDEGFEREESQIYADTRSTFHTGVKLVDTSDLVASTHYLRTLYAIRDEINNEYINGALSGFEPSRLESATVHVQESSLRQTALGRAISEANADADFTKTGVITLSELACSVTNAQEITNLTEIHSFEQSGDCELNDETCMESHIAYVLSQDLTYVAATYDLDSIKFTASNATGEVVLSIHNDFESDSVDKSELGESDSNTASMAEAKLRTKLHDTLVSVFNNRASNNNEQLVTLDVDADPNGLIVIGVGLDGCPVRQYCYAAFASGMLAPVITNNSAIRDELAGLVNYINVISE